MSERWIPSSHGFQVVTDDSMHAIALVKDTGDPTTQFQRASLLAAAPELLDAIERLLHLAEERVWPGPNTLAQARAAIAKAKGEQP